MSASLPQPQQMLRYSIGSTRVSMGTQQGAQTPFSTPVPNAHSNFNPSRVPGTAVDAIQPVAATVAAAALKPPKPPEKPLVPYMRFSRQMWHKVRDDNRECQLWDIGRKIGALWRELPDHEKQVYQDEWEGEKVDYDKAMKQYHNSPAYQAYLASKNPPKPTKDHRTHVRVESGVFIQSVDEDDGESQLSVRRVAAARFDRNQRLMTDLFGDAVVQDTRTVVTQHRMGMLKRQAASLASHQKNLENELVQLDEKFKAKKRMIEDASQQFSVRLKEVCEQKPATDDAKFAEMLKATSEVLMHAYKQSKEKAELAEEAAKREAEAQRAASEAAANAEREEREKNQVQTEAEDQTKSDTTTTVVEGAEEERTEEPRTATPPTDAQETRETEETREEPKKENGEDEDESDADDDLLDDDDDDDE